MGRSAVDKAEQVARSSLSLFLIFDRVTVDLPQTSAEGT